ncbi:hypothetical protein F5Y19DRAFT_482216 [Xylariaceae sp. FL1651]|nr:hypothetical protein F5Y19DRAFT_482216 [Xylariaceae sp. FL1651]
MAIPPRLQHRGAEIVKEPNYNMTRDTTSASAQCTVSRQRVQRRAGRPQTLLADRRAVTTSKARRLHAEGNEIAAADDRYNGVLSQAAFDSASLQGNIYQNLKQPGAQPAFHWDFGPASPVTTLGDNEATLYGPTVIKLGPLFTTRTTLRFGLTKATSRCSLAYPPFYLNTNFLKAKGSPDLRLDGQQGARSQWHRSDHGYLQGCGPLRSAAAISHWRRASFCHGAGRVGRPAFKFLAQVEPDVPTEKDSVTVRVTLSNGAFPFGCNGGMGGVLVRTIGQDQVQVPSLQLLVSGGWGLTHVPDFIYLSLRLQYPPGWLVHERILASFPALPAGRSAGASWKLRWPPKLLRVTIPSPIVVGSFLTQGLQAALGFLGISTATPARRDTIHLLHGRDVVAVHSVAGKFLYPAIPNTTAAQTLPHFHNGTTDAVVEQSNYCSVLVYRFGIRPRLCKQSYSEHSVDNTHSDPAWIKIKPIMRYVSENHE